MPTLPKVPSGIEGLDEILAGGLPAGRPTLVCGAAGCGKTLMGVQFLVRGALDHGEPGVLIAFEERVEDLQANVASLGFDLADLEARKLLSVDHIEIDPNDIVENGQYDLDGLFLRLGFAIDSVGAKRVLIDTLETIFGSLSNYGIVRAELRRLFEWLKEKGVTALITAERGDGGLTRHGLEEYVSDCVILLDHRVVSQVSTRRLRVVKYRGSLHGTNEYPYLIDETGLSVLPITSAGLDHAISDERVTSGVERLDAMLGGNGYYRGSTILVSGGAGSGKTSLAAHFADATCAAGENAVYFSFEESPRQIVRNAKAIGIDLQRHIDTGRLRFVASRPTAFGIETHLALIHRHVVEHAASAVIMDPASTFTNSEDGATQGMMVRLIDFLKTRNTTALMTSLTRPNAGQESSETEISSIVDTWLLLKTIELSGERNRGLYVLKSRGMAHSNQIREFLVTSHGIELADVYVGMNGVLTGSARAVEEARDRDEARRRELEMEQKQRRLAVLEARHREQLSRLQAEFDAESWELRVSIQTGEDSKGQLDRDRVQMASKRRADTGE